MTLRTKDYMRIVAVAAAGMAIAQLDGALIAFGICAFIAIILFICYY